LRDFEGFVSHGCLDGKDVAVLRSVQGSDLDGWMWTDAQGPLGVNACVWLGCVCCSFRPCLVASRG
jgi:hypothetical protein